MRSYDSYDWTSKEQHQSWSVSFSFTEDSIATFSGFENPTRLFWMGKNDTRWWWWWWWWWWWRWRVLPAFLAIFTFAFVGMMENQARYPVCCHQLSRSQDLSVHLFSKGTNASFLLGTALNGSVQCLRGLNVSCFSLGGTRWISDLWDPVAWGWHLSSLWPSQSWRQLPVCEVSTPHRGCMTNKKQIGETGAFWVILTGKLGTIVDSKPVIVFFKTTWSRSISTKSFQNL